MLSRFRRTSGRLSEEKHSRVRRFAAAGVLWVLGAQVLLCAVLPFKLRRLLCALGTVYMKRFWLILGCLYAGLMASIVVNVLLCRLIYTVELRVGYGVAATAGQYSAGVDVALRPKGETAQTAGQGMTDSLSRAGGILLAMSWFAFAESFALVAAAGVLLSRVSLMFIFAAIMTALFGLALHVAGKVCCTAVRAASFAS